MVHAQDPTSASWVPETVERMTQAWEQIRSLESAEAYDGEVESVQEKSVEDAMAKLKATCLEAKWVPVA